MSSKRATRERPIVQTRNPSTNRYVALDRRYGTIIDCREEPGPYPHLPVARRQKR